VKLYRSWRISYDQSCTRVAVEFGTLKTALRVGRCVGDDGEPEPAVPIVPIGNIVNLALVALPNWPFRSLIGL
jgi:hypothetical protein